jgi:hypothetical protein
MATIDRQHYALQTIFSFFLGLMVLAFIGVGVNTFYPSPAEKYTKKTRDISQKQEALNRKAAPGSFSPTEQARLDSLTAAQNEIFDRQQAEVKDWARITSIILVLFATLALVVSLLQSEQLRVISNGLLLGGLFTMVYGVGWVIFSGNSVARFWVISFALIVAIGLGYVKFVRGRRLREAEGFAGVEIGGGHLATGGTAPGTATDRAEQAASLVRRVEVLEARAAAAAAALAGASAAEREGDGPAGRAS